MANHPNNPERPPSKAVLAAMAANDIEALKQALTVRQRRFCEEYVYDFSGKNAAIRAGYSPKNATQQATVILMNTGVRYYIDYLSASKEAKITAVDPNYVIQKVTEIVMKHDAKDGDKLRGLELLARHLGMFIDRTEITGKDGEAIKYEEIQNEADNLQRRLARIAERRGKDGVALGVVTGGKG